MLYSPLDILNKILLEVGRYPVSSCQDNFLFVTYYHPTRRKLLCELKPEFTQKKIIIKDGSVKIPSGYLRTISELGYTTIDKVNHKLISQNKDEHELTYIYDVEDVSQFSDEFIEALCAELKKKII